MVDVAAGMFVIDGWRREKENHASGVCGYLCPHAVVLVGEAIYYSTPERDTSTYVRFLKSLLARQKILLSER